MGFIVLRKPSQHKVISESKRIAREDLFLLVAVIKRYQVRWTPSDRQYVVAID